jgi:hypothetical protein
MVLYLDATTAMVVDEEESSNTLTELLQVGPKHIAVFSMLALGRYNL